MGKLDPNVCYICLKQHFKVKKLTENDEDEITFKEKLNFCVPRSSEYFEDWFICQECVLLLRGAHKFINMVISSREYLKICGEHKSEEVKKENLKKENLKEKNLKEEVKLIKKEVNLSKNIKNIKNKNEYVCKICNVNLKNRNLLLKHFKKTHRKVKNEKINENKLIFNRTNKYECEYCKKTFKQSWHLHDHITTHIGDQKFKCILCDKSFSRLTSLRRHFKIHERAPGEKIKPSPVLCTICGKKILYSNGLQRHMRMHLGIKRHECEFCNRKFAQKTHLLAHRRTHTGEKPYVCDTCGEAFTLNASLKKHLDLHKKNIRDECSCY